MTIEGFDSTRVLLTGASGFIGRHVLTQFERQGVSVMVVGRTRPRGFSGKFIEADLLHPGSCESIAREARATHLVHMAWHVEHSNFWSSSTNLRWVDASVRLLESFCAEGGQHVVVAGTCAEYDWSAGYCREDETPLVPATLYGTAKDATRRLFTAICETNGVGFAWGRIFLPYGFGEDNRRLIPSLFEVFRGRRQPFGVNAEAFRDFIHVEDVSRGFVHLLHSNAVGSYNISSGKPTSIINLVCLVANACNADPRLVLDLALDRPSEPRLLVGDNSKLERLGWTATQNISERIQRYFAEFVGEK